MSAAKRWSSGFCAVGNPADSHARCHGGYTSRDGEHVPCSCRCHSVSPAGVNAGQAVPLRADGADAAPDEAKGPGVGAPAPAPAGLMSAHMECPRCEGRGYHALNAASMVETTDCPECGGTGESYDVECPRCCERTPDVLMCRHDADPLCVTCCHDVHDNPCPDCEGHGTLPVQLVAGRHDVICATCEGSGRINEGKP